MDEDVLFRLQKSWSEEGLFLLRQLLPLMSPVGRFQEWTREEGRTLGELLSACARSSESVMLLCTYGQLWDADVVSRSVIEGTLKAMYLLQSREHFKQRHQEYADDLFQIALLKDHKKAKALLDAVHDPDARSWIPIKERLLSQDEIQSIEQRFDRSRRATLDNKWGFTGLVSDLSRSGDPMFASIAASYHGYAMASYVLHADSMGVSIALERDLRAEKRRELVHLSHLQRLIVDQVIYLQMRLVVGYRFVGCPLERLCDVNAGIEKLRHSFGDVYERWLDVEYGQNVCRSDRPSA